MSEEDNLMRDRYVSALAALTKAEKTYRSAESDLIRARREAANTELPYRQFLERRAGATIDR